MPVIMPATKLTVVTVANAWVKALNGGQRFDCGSIRNKVASTANIVICLVPHGAAAPASSDYTDDIMYGPVMPGTTLDLGTVCSDSSDMYIRADDGSAGMACAVWGSRGI